jgi:hypothetical protein
MLSVHRDVPSSLLIMTAASRLRRYTLREESAGAGGIKKHSMQIRLAMLLAKQARTVMTISFPC